MQIKFKYYIIYYPLYYKKVIYFYAFKQIRNLNSLNKE